MELLAKNKSALWYANCSTCQQCPGRMMLLMQQLLQYVMRICYFQHSCIPSHDVPVESEQIASMMGTKDGFSKKSCPFCIFGEVLSPFQEIICGLSK
jgi:hypothetical protein